MSLESRYEPVIIRGRLVRHSYDANTKTTLTMYGEDNEIIYVPSDLVPYELTRKHDNELPAEIQVDILPLAGEKNRIAEDSIERFDCKPSMFGWVSRAQKKAWYEKSTLKFSVLKPTPECGFFLNGAHSFCLDEKCFPEVETMSEPVPARLTLISCYLNDNTNQ